MEKLFGFLYIAVALPATLIGFFTVLSWIVPDNILDDWHILFVIFYMFIVNKFVISPIEYFFNMKTRTYDPWFENKINKTGN